MKFNPSMYWFQHKDSLTRTDWLWQGLGKFNVSMKFNDLMDGHGLDFKGSVDWSWNGPWRLYHYTGFNGSMDGASEPLSASKFNGLMEWLVSNLVNSLAELDERRVGAVVFLLIMVVLESLHRASAKTKKIRTQWQLRSCYPLPTAIRLSFGSYCFIMHLLCY